MGQFIYSAYLSKATTVSDLTLPTYLVHPLLPKMKLSKDNKYPMKYVLQIYLSTYLVGIPHISHVPTSLYLTLL